MRRRALKEKELLKEMAAKAKKKSKNDSDDETVDEFFNDITKIMEQKGETINKKPEKYTLFDDAIMEE